MKLICRGKLLVLTIINSCALKVDYCLVITEYNTQLSTNDSQRSEKTKHNYVKKLPPTTTYLIITLVRPFLSTTYS